VAQILTVSELAEHLNVHRITIYRLLKAGAVPAFKIGRVWRFDFDEINKWIDAGKSTEAMKAATNGQVDGKPSSNGVSPASYRDGYLVKQKH